MACDFGAFDDDAHFGIEACGAWVEVEGANENAFLVHDECFGMQLVAELPVKPRSLEVGTAWLGWSSYSLTPALSKGLRYLT